MAFRITVGTLKYKIIKDDPDGPSTIRLSPDIPGTFTASKDGMNLGWDLNVYLDPLFQK